MVITKLICLTHKFILPLFAYNLRSMKKQSAGLLVYRKNGKAVEVFLVHPGGPFFIRKDVWGIPKGEYQDGEDPLAAAYREFEEEIGQKAPSGNTIDLGEIRRSDGKLIKVWAVEGNLEARIVSSSLFDLEWPPRSGKVQQFPEVDRAKWFDISQTSGKLHKGQETFIVRLADILGVKIGNQSAGPDISESEQQALL